MRKDLTTIDNCCYLCCTFKRKSTEKNKTMGNTKKTRGVRLTDTDENLLKAVLIARLQKGGEGANISAIIRDGVALVHAKEAQAQGGV